MPINFIVTPCSNPRGDCQTEPIQCLQNIPNNIFGISDVDGGNSVPAKIIVANPNPNTDFIVVNNSNILVNFKAVDWCIDIYRTGTYDLDDENRVETQFSSDNINSIGRGLIKRCEGFLQYDNKIVFLEIKDIPRARGGWVADARKKFEETILSFREHHPALAYQIVKPILCNPSFPGPHPNETIQKRILKDKILIEFVRKDSIII